MPKWTKSQQNAIDARGGSIIVSAAAGSGKTAVLVNRVVKLITHQESGVEADKLLVVTYTRAAAAELRERLSNKLQELVKEDPSNKFLISQQVKLQNSNISTIHSFCSSVVREFFYLLDIDRDFRIADESELHLIRQDALDLTFDDLYTNEDEGFTKLLDYFAGDKDDKQLRESVLTIYDFLLSHPFPKKWMNEKLSLYDVDNVNDSVYFKDIVLPYTKEAALYISSLINESLDLIDGSDVLVQEKVGSLLGGLKVFSNNLLDAIDTKDYDKVQLTFMNCPTQTFPSYEKLNNMYDKVSVKSNVDAAKKAITDLKEIYYFTEQQIIADIKELSVLASALFRVVDMFSENFKLLKANKRVADYSDLEHWMINLLYTEDGKLTDEAISLRDRYDEICVDEYQDANETQEYIFKALSKNDTDDNLFVVGDVKQSIYGFRQAMPEIFLYRKKNSIKYDENKEEFPACIILEKNFRSTKIVIDCVNYYFKKLMSESVGDIDYNDEEALVYNESENEDIFASTELDVIDLQKFEEENESIIEADFISKRIKQLMNDGVEVYDRVDGETIKRPLKYSDIAILMRSESSYSPIYVNELIKNGIPAFSKKSDSFLSSYEIMVITNMLKVIDNPTLDVELLSVLMSPIYGFTSDDITNVRLVGSKKGTLYSCVKKAADKGDSKCKHFLEELDYYRSVCITTPLADFINLIYDRTNYLSIVTAINETNLQKSNLRLFVTYARDYEANTHKGLSSFVSYITNLVEHDKDLNGGVDLDAGQENAVNIMSIHQSKGLEFPIVFLANTNRQFQSDTKENIQLDSKYGFAIKSKDIKNNINYETFPHIALKRQKKNEEISEELRVLYVAMTRAKQKLIIVTALKNFKDSQEGSPVDNTLNRIKGKMGSSLNINPFVVRNASCISDWILMCALIHRDGIVLRDRLGVDNRFDIYSTFDYSINIIEDINIERSIEENKNFFTNLNDDVEEVLNERKAFKYQYQEILDLPSKVTVTELAHRESNYNFDKTLRAPAFYKNQDMNAMEKGTAFHNLVEYIDFAKARVDLQSEIDRIVSKGYITQIQADNIDRNKLEIFLNNDLVSRSILSPRVEKEYKFTSLMYPSNVKPELKGKFASEYISLNGSIDLAFVEDNQWVLIDYKTDRVKDINELVDRYRYQVVYYKQALENVTDLKVKECYIYSVYLGKSIEIKEE